MSTSDLYTSFFGFSERPFTLLPDPDFLYWSPAHTRAFSVLEYGVVTRAPLTVITGEVGAGKTTLVQHLIKTLDENVKVGLISNAQGGRGDLLRWVLNALDIIPPAHDDYIAAFQKFQDYLIEEYADGNHVVLIIDEAQNLSVEALEELRMLTNVNSNKDELLQLILVGQPELRDIISRPDLRQFAQRVSATYHIKPMELDMTVRYITHRLKHVGGTGKEFARTAMDKIHEETGGIPRLVNKLCDLALVYTAGSGKKKVTLKVIEELLEDDLFVNTQNTPPLLLTPQNRLIRAVAE